MQNRQILEVIQSLLREYKEKDGGRSFVKNFGKRILNSDGEDQQAVLLFLLSELETNDNHLFSLARHTFSEIKAEKYSNQIEDIFIRNSELKEEKWRYQIIELLIELNHKPVSKSLDYYKFIKTHYDKNPNGTFFLLVKYCKIDKSRGYNLLAKYFASFGLTEIENSALIMDRLSFLTSFFDSNKELLIKDLVKLIHKNSTLVGNFFKERFPEIC
ncbi:MAG: hypothetical protein EOM23_08335 [Candidatus Moranbacteria bacterium]|nr:hypothetical protein [Candidatus Moranbacteria bacterium]